MCTANKEFQSVNPTTQVALFTLCLGRCVNIQNITWNLYQGVMNTSTNITQWIRYNQMITYKNIWFFGKESFLIYLKNTIESFLGGNTTNFTSSNQLFLSHRNTTLWRFEVIYTFPTGRSSSALNFVINQPPFNGTCSINPHNGTTSTLFNISCINWFDDDGIKDYSFYSKSIVLIELFIE